MDKKFRYMMIGAAVLLILAAAAFFFIKRNVSNQTEAEKISEGSPENGSEGNSGIEDWVQKNSEENSDEVPADAGQEPLRHCLVRVNADSNVASGIVLEVTDESVIICTAKHLVAESYESVVTFYDGRSGRARTFYYSPQHDFAFLRIDAKENPDFDFTGLEAVPYTEEETKNLYKGQDIMVFASKSGAGKDKVTGLVSDTEFFVQDFNDWMILLECEIQHGYSGGGVFAEDGRFIGLVVGSDGEYGVCIPQAVIIEEYRKETEEST